MAFIPTPPRVGMKRDTEPWSMNVHADELDPPFEILEPAELRGPVVFNSPHSGCVYPRAFLAAARLDLATLRRSEDCFVDELLLGVVSRGHPLMRAHFPRHGLSTERLYFDSFDYAPDARPLPTAPWPA